MHDIDSIPKGSQSSTLETTSVQAFVIKIPPMRGFGTVTGTARRWNVPHRYENQFYFTAQSGRPLAGARRPDPRLADSKK